MACTPGRKAGAGWWDGRPGRSLRLAAPAGCLLFVLLAGPGCSSGARREAAAPPDTAQLAAPAEVPASASPDTHRSAMEHPRGEGDEGDEGDEGSAAHKFDAPLRIRLGQVGEGRPEVSLQCLVELEAGAGPAQREQLEQAGLRVVTLAGNVATVEGDAAALRRAARLDFVRTISLSQTRRPLR